MYKGALKSSKNVVIDSNTPPHKAHNGQSMMYGNPQNRFPDWLHLALSSGLYCDSGGDHLLSDNIMAHSPHTSHCLGLGNILDVCIGKFQMLFNYDYNFPRQEVQAWIW